MWTIGDVGIVMHGRSRATVKALASLERRDGAHRVFTEPGGTSPACNKALLRIAVRSSVSRIKGEELHPAMNRS